MTDGYRWLRACRELKNLSVGLWVFDPRDYRGTGFLVLGLLPKKHHQLRHVVVVMDREPTSA